MSCHFVTIMKTLYTTTLHIAVYWIFDSNIGQLRNFKDTLLRKCILTFWHFRKKVCFRTILKLLKTENWLLQLIIADEKNKTAKGNLKGLKV